MESAGRRLPFALEGEGWGGCLRGGDPVAVFRSRGRAWSVEAGKRRTGGRGDPFDALRQFLRRHVRGARRAFGFLSYDLGRHIERVPVRARDDLRFPDCFFAVPARFERSRNPARAPGGPVRATALPPNMSRAAFVRAVARAVRYIRAGDIFQVNLSRRFSARVDAAPADLYALLRDATRAPFAAWIDAGEGRHVVSTSPELFLRVRGDRVETRPIKGTRPRGGTAAADRRQRRALERSEKERAELAMIVDLERNDLGRVCRVGSVKVVNPRAIESFPSVHHGIATVTGRLRPDVDLVDLLRATFPGGSITGAPKVRAMEIVEELEPTRRGPYTGAIGWIGAGAMDLSIAIRTVLLDRGTATWQAGAGITAESDPAAEERETRAKASGIEKALGIWRSRTRR